MWKKKQKFKQTGNSRDFYQNELDKASFQHEMAYGDFKDLTRRTASDKILHNKAFNIAKNLKYDGYRRVLDSIVYKLFDEKTSGEAIENENVSNENVSNSSSRRITQTYY